MYKVFLYGRLESSMVVGVCGVVVWEIIARLLGVVIAEILARLLW